jgi:hypothetical protein
LVDEIVGRRNARNSKRLDLERPALRNVDMAVSGTKRRRE